MNENFEQIGKAFIDQFYKLFDGNREGLRPFYRDDSLLTFEGAQMQGVNAILEKLKSLPFQTVQHVVTTGDCHPTIDYGVLVHVVGQLKTDNDPPHSFSQTFCLRRDPVNPNNYYVLNDVFRLSLHHG
ncbi:nuclear transport factor 2-like [Xenia sp. Carnegie-2017]|uniref:nuclear transport factor 2-like n=1 Tax=Xenia sp. Carnegie-2017 TaxID=2897299 RepID=UPI001F0455F6|nr:nuclear transport factor 2-like [Xenia sp. Carnegie-2017]